MMKKIVIGFIALNSLFLCGKSVLASDRIEHKDLHNNDSGFELGLSVGYAYLKEEKEKGAVLHAHLMKRLSGEGLLNYISLGFGAETIFLDEMHYGAMVTIAVHPWENVIFSLSPGVEWAAHDGKTEYNYATHMEAAYVFEVLHFHVGPVVGYSKTKDYEHYTVGVHIGIPL